MNVLKTCSYTFEP